MLFSDKNNVPHFVTLSFGGNMASAHMVGMGWVWNASCDGGAGKDSVFIMTQLFFPTGGVDCPLTPPIISVVLV